MPKPSIFPFERSPIQKEGDIEAVKRTSLLAQEVEEIPIILFIVPRC
jgi:hypothetical protein